MQAVVNIVPGQARSSHWGPAEPEPPQIQPFLPTRRHKKPTCSFLPEEEDHHGWQISDMAFRAWGTHISGWSTWDKNINRTEVGEETWFFCTKYLAIPCFKSQTRITGTLRLLHQDGCAAVAQGGDRGSLSYHCIAKSEPEPMVHHSARMQCWYWPLLSNKTLLAFSAGAAIATYSVLDRFLSNWNSLSFWNRSFSLHFCLVQAYKGSWFQLEHSDFHTSWSTYNLLTWKVFI